MNWHTNTPIYTTTTSLSQQHTHNDEPKKLYIYTLLLIPLLVWCLHFCYTHIWCLLITTYAECWEWFCWTIGHWHWVWWHSIECVIVDGFVSAWGVRRDSVDGFVSGWGSWIVTSTVTGRNLCVTKFSTMVINNICFGFIYLFYVRRLISQAGR